MIDAVLLCQRVGIATEQSNGIMGVQETASDSYKQHRERILQCVIVWTRLCIFAAHDAHDGIQADSREQRQSPRQ